MNQTALRVVVAAPLDGVRAALRALVADQWGWQVVGDASDGLAAIRTVRETHADVLLLDGSIQGPDVAGVRALVPPSARHLVVALVGHPSELAQPGVSMLKESPGERIREAVVAALEAHWADVAGVHA